MMELKLWSHELKAETLPLWSSFKTGGESCKRSFAWQRRDVLFLLSCVCVRSLFCFFFQASNSLLSTAPFQCMFIFNLRFPFYWISNVFFPQNSEASCMLFNASCWAAWWPRRLWLKVKLSDLRLRCIKMHFIAVFMYKPVMILVFLSVIQLSDPVLESTIAGLVLSPLALDCSTSVLNCINTAHSNTICFGVKPENAASVNISNWQ